MPGIFLPWFERYPGLLEREAESFRAAGLDFHLNNQLREKAGIVVFDGAVRAGGQTHRLRVVYPSGFPFFRPEVICPTVTLPRHQNPLEKNLCLLPNEQHAWSQEDTGATMVGQAIALLDASAQGPEAVAACEVDAPEPRSVFYPYDRGAAFLVLEELPPIPPRAHGEFSLSLEQPSNNSLTAVLTGLQFANGTAPWVLSDALRHTLIGQQFRGVWLGCPEHPPCFQPRQGGGSPYGDYLAWARTQHEKFSYHFDKQRQGGVKAYGLVYQEEGPARGQYHVNWLVGLELPGLKQALLLRPALWTRADHFRRMPALQGLGAKKVAVIGLGALGSPLAISLARAGVGHFGLVDHDIVDAGPIARQEFDVADLGLHKVEAVARRVRRVNPHAVVCPFPYALGGASLNPGADGRTRDQLAEFADAVQGYDLLISTTGLRGVDLVVNEIGATLTTPRLFAWVLNGAWGGRVFRVEPGRACYECLAHSWESLPRPEEDPSEVPVFARGCGFPTFTGTGFDAGAVANLTARLAVQTLLASQAGAYPDTAGNLINWSNRSAGEGEFPRIEHLTVHRHERCRTCQQHST